MLNIKKPSGELGLLFILAGIQFAHILDFMILMPLGAELMTSLDISAAEFGWLVSSYTIGAAISGFIGFFHIDRFDRKRALVVVEIGFIAGALACAMAPGYETLLAARFISGLFGGVQNGLILSIIGDVVPFERRGAAMGIVMVSFSVASALGVPAGLYFAAMVDWHFPFWIVSVLSGFLLVAILVFIPAMSEHNTSGAKKSVRQVLTENFGDRNKMTALLFMAFLMLSFFPFVAFLTPYLESTVGIAKEDIWKIYAIGGGITFVTSWLMGKAADRFGKKEVFTICASLIAIPVVWLSQTGPASLGIVLVMTSMLFIFANGRMVTAMSIATSVARPENRGSFMSLNATVQHLAMSASAAVGGLLIIELPDGTMQGYENNGYLSLIFLVLVIAAVWFIKPITGETPIEPELEQAMIEESPI